MVLDPTLSDPMLMEQADSCASSTPADNLREICREFQATIVDFFVTDQEVMKEIQHASVYDVVYGIGPDTIMEDFYGARIQKPPSFRWIHLPINYVSSSCLRKIPFILK
jgi:hypothetical protein